jgi:hypothetical protein
MGIFYARFRNRRETRQAGQIDDGALGLVDHDQVEFRMLRQKLAGCAGREVAARNDGPLTARLFQRAG